MALLQPCKKEQNKWTKDEVRRMVGAYAGRTETQINRRIREIKNLFPNRSEKAIATKLGETHPDIYKIIIQQAAIVTATTKIMRMVTHRQM